MSIRCRSQGRSYVYSTRLRGKKAIVNGSGPATTTLKADKAGRRPDHQIDHQEEEHDECDVGATMDLKRKKLQVDDEGRHTKAVVGKGGKRPAVSKRPAASRNSRNAAPILKPLMRARPPPVSPDVSAYMGCRVCWGKCQGERMLMKARSVKIGRMKMGGTCH